MDIIEYTEELSSKWTDTLSKISGLTLLTYNKDKYLSCQEKESHLCKLLQEQTAGKAFCEQDCTLPLVQALKNKEVVYFKCYANLHNAVIPLGYNGSQERKRLMMTGRIFTSYNDLAGYREIAEKLGCEKDQILNIAKSVTFKDIDAFKESVDAIKTATGLFIQSVGREKSIDNRISKLDTMIRVAVNTGPSLEDKEFFKTILNTLGVLFNVKSAMILVRKHNEFKVEMVFGHEKDNLSGFKSEIVDGLIGEAVVRNEVISSTNVFNILKSGFQNNVTSVTIFPVSVEDSVEGLIVILNTEINKEDEDLISSFCRTISLSFQNRVLSSRRENFSKKGGEVLQALNSIASNLDSPELCDVILENAAEVTGAEQGSLMLLDTDNYKLEVKATKGLNIAILNYIRINPGEGIAGVVLEKGTPVIVNNIENDDRFARPNRVRYKTKSFISIPVMIKDTSIGVINLSDKKDGSDFSDMDIKLLETVALYSAVAIERRIYYQSAISLKKISITDPLTSLLNRRYFEERIAEELERSRRHVQPFSLIIIDIDNFKGFNDTYGHLHGDEALRNTAMGIRKCIRVIDIAARYGGEEFAVILPTTDKVEAMIIGKRIRDEIDKMSIPIRGKENAARLTISLGIATYPVDASTIDDLINNADRALYKAKGLGKNRVVLFGNDTTDI